MKRFLGLVTVSTVLISSALPASADIIPFSQGLATPETISLAPAGFGSFGGSYFIPDPGKGPVFESSTIWVVPPSGGAPSVFYQTPNAPVLGGLFLPPSF